ncbi:MAG: peptidylprolyl isomerase [Verrucomicrobia bacterium]|nr:peptidylprolyl isomerase [Verrucomicrobiota bacterium]
MRNHCIWTVCLLAVVAAVMVSCAGSDQGKGTVEVSQSRDTQDESSGPTAIVKSEHGEITIRLLPDAAPKTVANFVALAKEGYFDGITWHRVVPRYVIQTGDPTGTGVGGKTADGKPLPDEICAEALGIDTLPVRDFERLAFLRDYYGKMYNVDVDEYLDRPLKEFFEAIGFTYTPGLKTRKALKGMVGMAHSGPGTAKSQWFIITDEAQPHLNGTFTFFAEVTAGLDVAHKIKQGDKIESITIVEE